MVSNKTINNCWKKVVIIACEEEIDCLIKKDVTNLVLTVNPRPVAHGVVRKPQWASSGSDSRHNY